MSETPAPPQGSGLEPNVAGALSYLLGPFTGVLFLMLNKEDRFVRFHALQCIALSIAWVGLWIVLTVISAILSAIPVIGWLIGLFLSLGVGLGGFVLWVYLMYQAFQGHEWEIPVIGAQARRYLTPRGGPPAA